MFFIQVLQVDFLADFQFTQVYTGLLFLPPDEWLFWVVHGQVAVERPAKHEPV